MSMDVGGVLPTAVTGKRRIMVVIDPIRESVGALEWALRHAVVERDEIILLHVESAIPRRSSSFSIFLCRPPPPVVVAPAGGLSASTGGDDVVAGDYYDFINEMRAMCETAQPKAKVLVERAELEKKDKAATILAKTKLLQVDLLVVGQRRNAASFLSGFYRFKLSGSLSIKAADTAEFLIENSKCLCVGVQKKGQNAGYVLNTKTHKNFWLLA
ncbi:hypothetical protein Cni_G19413 [Canna indica]|uniref:UspA domain-containing protein n=1 Tax=Canna indica TaxID=4628 RepID=A0AAQ3KM50_9LILI|nr:hypothetical protein Cni_G19413 [Canna indica]